MLESWRPVGNRRFSLKVKVKVTQPCPILCHPMDCIFFATPWTVSLEFSRAEYWNGEPFPFPGDLSNPGIEPRSSTLQVDSLPSEPQGKPKNPVVGSLTLLQQIFLTQESTGISCIRGGFFTNRAMEEALLLKGACKIRDCNPSTKVQSCLTFCDPMDYSQSGSSVHGIFQARILECVTISFSKASS